MIQKRFEYATLSKRTIVISDIHGHVSLLKQLLKKVQYSKEDTLVIVGDFLEKGPEVLETVHFLMDLARYPNVHILNGNCEWALCEWIYRTPYLKTYLKRARYSLVREILDSHEVDEHLLSDTQLQTMCQWLLKNELTFIQSLPVALETKDYLFVHAGVEYRQDYQESSLSSLIEQQFFMRQGHLLDRYVIVGHLPTSNYRRHHIDNRILIDDNKKIISIDGGVGVKEVCQLNALIIEDDHFKQVFVSPFDEVMIKKEYCPEILPSHKIAWPNFEVTIIKQEAEFSLCKNKFDEEMWIKNEYLYSENDKAYCFDDYEDTHLCVKKGDLVFLIKICGQYAYIMKNHQVGWIKKDCLYG